MNGTVGGIFAYNGINHLVSWKALDDYLLVISSMYVCLGHA